MYIKSPQDLLNIQATRNLEILLLYLKKGYHVASTMTSSHISNLCSEELPLEDKCLETLHLPVGTLSQNPYSSKQR